MAHSNGCLEAVGETERENDVDPSEMGCSAPRTRNAGGPWEDPSAVGAPWPAKNWQ